jgi:hypothetical protein
MFFSGIKTRLVAHVGFAKCGSSSLRRFLLDGEARLRDLGCSLGMSWPDCWTLLRDRGAELGLPDAGRRPFDASGEVTETAEDAVTRLNGTPHLILSSESFASFPDPGRLLRGLERDRTDVFWCLRRQDRVADRGVAELALRPEVTLDEAMRFAEAYLAVPYDELAERWESFPGATVHPFPVPSGADVLPAFSELLGDLSPGVAVLRENPGLPTDASAFLFEMKSFVPSDSWTRVCDGFRYRLRGLSRRSGAVTPMDFRAGLLRSARSGNERLLRRFGFVPGLVGELADGGRQPDRVDGARKALFSRAFEAAVGDVEALREA